MRRVKLILSLLIAALWMAGTPGWLSKQVAGPAACQAGKSLSAAGHNPYISTSAAWFDQNLQGAVRHPTSRPGSERVLLPTIIDPPDLQLTVAAMGCFEGAREAFRLAQSWQFQWRAAPQPRAPSSVC